MTPKSTIDQLKNHVPRKSYGYVVRLLESYELFFRISRPRVTKLGDYKYDRRTRKHAISVNADLNPYLFLITFMHEFAHFLQHTNYRRRTRPHGSEWKREFQTLMRPLIEESIFPDPVTAQLDRHMENPKASCSDIALMRLLEDYDTALYTRLEDLNDGDLFRLSNQRTFQRKKKLRTRYECIEVSTNRKWFVHSMAKVEIVNN